jgi:hypothetical protein
MLRNIIKSRRFAKRNSAPRNQNCRQHHARHWQRLASVLLNELCLMEPKLQAPPK